MPEPAIIWCIFPNKGSFHGPGGRLLEEVELKVLAVLISRFSTMNAKMKKLRSVGKDGRLLESIMKELLDQINVKKCFV